MINLISNTGIKNNKDVILKYLDNRDHPSTEDITTIIATELKILSKLDDIDIILTNKDNIHKINIHYYELPQNILYNNMTHEITDEIYIYKN